MEHATKLRFSVSFNRAWSESNLADSAVTQEECPFFAPPFAPSRPLQLFFADFVIA
jgi:hypothetical protein